MSNLLDIVIPLYNGERYIAGCLDSLLGQLNEETSVILVNDGSTDNGINLVKTKYQKYLESGRLVVHSQANKGVSAARNAGIQMSRAKYVAFVDGDDMVDEGYVAAILFAMKSEPDIIELGCRVVDESGCLLIEQLRLNKFKGLHNAAKVLPRVCDRALWYPFLRVSKRTLLQHDFFPEGVRFCEDMMAFYSAYQRAETVYCGGGVVYSYRINSSGATKNIRPDYYVNLLAFYRSLSGGNRRAINSIKLNIAYAMRRCSAASDERFGALPSDVERDMLKLAFLPSSYLRANVRVAFMAIWGGKLNWIKKGVK